ncbi:MAG: transporter [Sphingomicrobium sp.]
MRGHQLFAAMLALALAGRGGAGTMRDSICTDRPGKGSATCTAPKGHWQIEMSLADWSLTKEGGTRHRELDLGETAIKYGVSDRLHVEIVVPAYVIKAKRSAGKHDRENGFDDMKVKVKQELTPEGADFAAAFYPFVKLPTASKRIGNSKVEGGLVVPLSWSFGTSPWSLSASPELDINADGDGHGYHAGMAQTLSVNLQATARLSLSTEYWGSWGWEHGETSREATLGGNASYQLSSEWQLDGEIDFGLTRDSTGLEISGGVSMRF